MPTVVFANRKGGVGKTLSTLYTGRWLARAGRDVTLVDLDRQQGLWDIAAVLGCPDGVLTRRPPALDGRLPALNQSD
jgi:septum formation inhibitor-activating ATPase MinD